MIGLNDYVYSIQNHIGATAAATYIIQNDVVVNEWYSGKHDLGMMSRNVDAKSQFNVGSVRKTYLGFVVSLLVERRIIKSIDDEISVYMKELSDITPEITIRHCLTHTHGLNSHEGKYTNSFVAGNDWAYTNSGIGILFQLVKCLTGMTLAEYINQEVFELLGFVESGWRTHYDEHLIYNYYNEESSWVGPNDSPDGDQSNLFVSARELAMWGNLHLRKGNFKGEQIYPKSVFDRITSLQTPDTLRIELPRQGYIWWLQYESPLNQIGDKVPEGSYQILGITGCACLVIPEYELVAVRMYNQLSNPEGYSYLQDIRRFGNEVMKALKEI